MKRVSEKQANEMLFLVWHKAVHLTFGPEQTTKEIFMDAMLQVLKDEGYIKQPKKTALEKARDKIENVIVNFPIIKEYDIKIIRELYEKAIEEILNEKDNK
jgi:hypothetical protein